MGLQNNLMKRQNCKQEQSCYASKRTVKKSKARFFEVNIRSVHAVQGIWHSGLSQVCASMDLPHPVTFKSYNSILQHVRMLLKWLNKSCMKLQYDWLQLHKKNIWDNLLELHSENLLMWQ